MADLFGRFCRVVIFASLTLGAVTSGAAPVWGQIPAGPFLRIEAEMHTARINRIAVDAGGRYLITASLDKTARIWDLATGRLLRILRPPIGDDDAGKLYAVALSPDGAVVAIGGWTSPVGTSMSIYLFDRASGRLVGRIGGLPDVVNHLAFSEDGEFLAAALGGTNGIRVYRVRDRQEVARDASYGDASYSVEFDRRGRLVSTSWDGLVRLYGPLPGFRPLARERAPGGQKPFAARFSPDGTQIAVGFYDSVAVNVLSGSDLHLRFAPDSPQVASGDLPSVAWSVDGTRLHAAGSYEVRSAFPILTWPQGGRGPVQTWPSGATNTVMDLRALPDGRLAFGAAGPAWGVLDTTGQLWLSRPSPILSHWGSRAQFRLARDGGVVEFGFDTWTGTDWRRRLARFDLRDRRLELDPASVPGLEPARTTGLTVTGWKDTNAPKLDNQPLVLDSYERSRSLAIASDASRFVLGTEWSIRLFDRGGRQVWRKSVPGVAWAVNLTADGRYVVAALGDGTLRWYAAADGAERMALFVLPDGQRWVLWTPEGFYDAAPGADTLIGYQLNQGEAREGEFVSVDRLARVFYRPDLVTRRLEGQEQPIRDALARIGDVRQVLARGLPPALKLLSPEVTDSPGDYVLQFQVADQGGGVGRVVYRVNGQELEGRPEGIPAVGAGPVSRRFSLAPGRNVLSATVYNRDDQIASRSIEAVVTVTRPTTQPDLYILAVGVTRYKDQAFARGVKFAAFDARAMTDALRAGGQGLYRNVHATVLSDGEATLQKIEQAFADLAAPGRMRPDDVFVFFAAGHGAARDGQYHFIPTELIYENDDVLRERSLSHAKLERHLAKIPARKTLVVLDTCSAGAMAGRTGPEDKAAIARLMQATGRAILAAAAADQMALETGKNGHGVFTFALLEALTGKAADTNRDGFVDVHELGNYLAKRVPEITKELAGIEQSPMRKTVGEPFPVTRTR